MRKQLFWHDCGDSGTGEDGSCASIVFREMSWLACALSAGTVRCKPRRSDAVHALCNLTHVHGT